MMFSIGTKYLSKHVNQNFQKFITFVIKQFLQTLKISANTTLCGMAPNKSHVLFLIIKFLIGN